MPNTPSNSFNYSKLLREIRKIISTGRAAIQTAQAETYWKVGKYISDYILNGADRAKYGAHVYDKLSKDLKIDHATLNKAVRFAREYPIMDARPQLPWTQVRTLLSLPNRTVRTKLIRKTIRENLTSRELQKEVDAKREWAPIPLDKPIPQLKVTRGNLYTYKIVLSETIQAAEPEKMVDCGFEVGLELPAAQLAKFKDGDIIESVKEDDVYKMKSSPRTAADLYTFKARVLRIVDGDTLLVRVNLGFNMKLRQRLRFRGINCPELSTKEGQAVKRFIEERIKPNDFVIIKTHKVEKFGRYLVDVWYAPLTEGREAWDEGRVAAEGIYLNQELLDNRLAIKM